MSFTSRRDSIDKAIVLGFVVCVLAMVALPYYCSPKQNANNNSTAAVLRVSKRTDSIPYEVAIPPVSVTAKELPMKIVYKEGVDSVSRRIVAQQIGIIDSLKKLLRESQKLERMCFGTESIVPTTGDSLFVECDALTNSVLLYYQFKARTVKVPETTTTIEVLRDDKFFIGFSAGYGVYYSQDNTLRMAPNAGISIGYKLIGF